MLEVKNLKKSFENNLVLNDVSFTINQGEIVTVIGPSGAGKTTLLRCINGLEDVDKGEIQITNKCLVKKYQSDYRAKGKELIEIRKNIGMVFQNFNLFPHMSVLENIIEAPMKVYNRNEKDTIEEAYDVLYKLGIKDKANNYPYELSGGQKQRVAIARALILDPRLLSFDEPTSALDPELRLEVASIIKSLVTKERAVLIITHDMEFAKRVSTRIIFMDKGYIVKDDNMNNYFNSTDNKRIIEFIR
ncbi:amino acid ABC transporter ATP-binding protein [Clostridium sp. D2Q-11]|uniref:Amino acid ABC transporter ATP-binding protein n=1 Tax=Anaeromonas frigoriresistens TaxID=2683708 RepID=A0A942Z933_9FIRM|nr:amino acid ABC transporter ATP-binding protein [Anaeromonas frigoriresistens]